MVLCEHPACKTLMKTATRVPPAADAASGLFPIPQLSLQLFYHNNPTPRSVSNSSDAEPPVERTRLPEARPLSSIFTFSPFTKLLTG